MPRNWRYFAPRRSIISVVLLLIAVLSGVFSFTRFQQEGRVIAADIHIWKTYTNVRFQYSICYPADLLVPQGEAENSDGQKFLSQDGTQLLVYGRNNALKDSLKTLFEQTGSRLASDRGAVSYKVLKPSWFAVSGKKDNLIFYAKTLSANQQFKSFEMTYPAETSSSYNPVVVRIAACFSNSQS